MSGKRAKQDRNKQLNRNRGHGLGRHVKPTPAMLKRAAERAHLYRNARHKPSP
jgi:hypothetical protein